MFLRTPLSLSLFSQLGEWWWWWWCVAMVLHEEPRAMCSNSNSGGGSRSSSKKSKQKKPPQRGMGVAQLEELRMREQQQHKSTVVPSSSGLILASAQQPSLPFLASDTNILCPRSCGDFLGHPPPLVESSSAGCSGSAESGLLPVLEPCPRDPEVVARRYSLHSSLQTANSLQRWPQQQHHHHQQQQKFQMVYGTSSSSS